MSVQKNFRISDWSNACLELIAEREGKTQTEIIQQLIKGYVIFDLKPEESNDLMQAAEKRLDTIKSREMDKE